jgi:hypothetical protein
MKALAAVSVFLSAVALTSCGGGQSVEINQNTQPVAGRWNGVLATPPELAGIAQLRGQAWMGADEENRERTRAQVQISNAVPGGQHPWHVHRGQCGSDQGIFGPADAYEPLKVEGNGRATSSATLPVAFPRTGEYFVNVHASSKNMRAIVACGNLAPPAR